MEPFNSYFLTALKSCLRNKPHGIKARLARDASISPSQLCDILKNRSYGSEATRRKIAKALGYQYESFLELGKQIVNDDLSIDNDLPKESNAQAKANLNDGKILELIQQIMVIAQHDANELVYLKTMAEVTLKKLKLHA